jgi:hypothetical protein
MTKLQGFMRLTIGFSRILSNSEILRGYVFISHDKEINKLGSLNIIINKKKFASKIPDNSGRIAVGKKITKEMSNKNCHLRLKGNDLYLDY